MGKTEVRRRAKRRIDSLSDERIDVADDFLAYLQERESNEATEELLRIPGFIDRLKEAEKDIAESRTVAVEDLRRKY